MESTIELKNDERIDHLKHWLHTVCSLSPDSLQPMIGDASCRRYFRIDQPNGSSLVVMDAPPPQEDCRPYVAVAKALRARGLITPDIIQADLTQGFLLITDFGDLTYLKALHTLNADSLYTRALDALAILQGCEEVPGQVIPLFNKEKMWQEWLWHQEWFLHKLLGLSLTATEQQALDHCFTLLMISATSQPQVFMHRDFHSANLMALENGSIGILDFQDAFRGPVTYDLVSLLRDCYVDWPNEQVEKWVGAYWRRLRLLGVLPDVRLSLFLLWFDWMGIERHLKALFTFARKEVRDQQSRYLQYVPRTLTYLLKISKSYPELAALHHYLHDKVQPAWEARGLCER